jgi:hypothetical protein
MSEALPAITIVLKLDFMKDTVSWVCLFNILQIRGFDRNWIKWMQMYMESAKTALLLNGVLDSN